MRRDFRRLLQRAPLLGLAFLVPACGDPTGPGPLHLATRWHVDALSLTTRDLHALRALGSGNFIGVGSEGEVLRMRHGALQVEQVPGASVLTSVWAASHEEAIAVGGGTSFRFDDGAWRGLEAPPGAWLVDVWGADGEVYAIASDRLDGLVLRLDGSTWTEIRRFGNASLTAIGGTSADDLIVVGHSTAGSWVGWRSGGAGWQPMEFPAPEGVQRIAALDVRADGEAVVVGSFARNGVLTPVVLRLEGAGWRIYPLFPSSRNAELESVSMGPEGTVLIVGGSTLYRLANGAWSTASTPDDVSIHAVRVLSPDEAYAVGASGTLLRFDGAAWRTVTRDVPPLRAAWISPRGGVTFAAGDYAALRLNADRWMPTEGFLSQHFTDLWGLRSSNLIGVGYGNGGEGIIFHFDGARWNYVSDFVFYYDGALLGVSGLSSGAALAVGENGIAAYYSGSGWTRIVSPVTAHLRGVWGSSDESAFYVVGDDGTILRYDGAWEPVESPTDADLFAIWGTGPDMMIAVGATADGGVILRFDGDQWRVDQLVPTPLRTVHGRNASSIYAAGDDGAVYVHDGEKWTSLDPLISTPIDDLWVSGSGEIVAVSSGRAILRASPVSSPNP